MSGTNTPTPVPAAVSTASPMASLIAEWGAIVVSVLISVIFLVSMVTAWRAPAPPSTLLTTSVATANAAFLAMVGYWLGSSRESAKKTDILAAQTTPPDVVSYVRNSRAVPNVAESQTQGQI